MLSPHLDALDCFIYMSSKPECLKFTTTEKCKSCESYSWSFENIGKYFKILIL